QDQRSSRQAIKHRLRPIRNKRREMQIGSNLTEQLACRRIDYPGPAGHLAFTRSPAISLKSEHFIQKQIASSGGETCWKWLPAATHLAELRNRDTFSQLGGLRSHGPEPARAIVVGSIEIKMTAGPGPAGERIRFHTGGSQPADDLSPCQVVNIKRGTAEA